jgi:hypothetical protein
MPGAPKAAASTERLFPRRELGGDHAVAEPDLAAIGNLGVRMTERRELGGIIDVRHNHSPSNRRGWIDPRVEVDRGGPLLKND